MDQKHDVHLDMMRGLAALLVMANHLRSFVFVDYAQLKYHSVWAKVFYFATSLGHQSVIIFFVLSGFLVGGNAYKRIHSRQWSWFDYALARLSRLWVVLLPALFLTCFWDKVGMYMGSPYYTGAMNSVYHSGPVSGEFSLSVMTFIGNLFFLQNVVTHIYGTNGPLWSLTNEAFYYLMFPCLMLTFYPQRVSNSIIYRLFYGVFTLVLAILIPTGILVAMACWLFGCAAALLKPYIFKEGKRLFHVLDMGLSFVLWLPMLSVLLVVLILCRTGGGLFSFAMGSDIILALTLALFILTLPEIEIHEKKSIYINMSGKMADMSYSLYLTHFPLLGFLCTFLFQNKMQFSIMGIGIYIILALTALSYAFIVYWLFERRTPILRRYLKQCFVKTMA